MSEAPIQILDELEEFMPLTSRSTNEELEKSILEDGIRDPVIIWKERNVLVDGHRRWRISQKHGGLPVKRIYRPFTNIDEVKQYMIRIALARRDLSNAEKRKFQRMLADNVVKSRKGKVPRTTVAEAAEHAGVSVRTMERAVQHAQAEYKLTKLIPPEEAKKIPAKTMIELSKLPIPFQDKIARAVEKGEYRTLTEAVLGEKAAKPPKKPVHNMKKDAQKQLGLFIRAVNDLIYAQESDNSVEVRQLIDRIGVLLEKW